MKNGASKKQTRLLDALDQSFSLSDSPAGPTQLETPLTTTPLRGQTTVDHYFEADSTSSKQEHLRNARQVHDAEQRNAAGEYQVSH